MTHPDKQAKASRERDQSTSGSKGCLVAFLGISIVVIADLIFSGGLATLLLIAAALSITSVEPLATLLSSHAQIDLDGPIQSIRYYEGPGTFNRGLSRRGIILRFSDGASFETEVEKEYLQCNTNVGVYQVSTETFRVVTAFGAKEFNTRTKTTRILSEQDFETPSLHVATLVRAGRGNPLGFVREEPKGDRPLHLAC